MPATEAIRPKGKSKSSTIQKPNKGKDAPRNKGSKDLDASSEMIMNNEKEPTTALKSSLNMASFPRGGAAGNASSTNNQTDGQTQSNHTLSHLEWRDAAEKAEREFILAEKGDLLKGKESRHSR